MSARWSPFTKGVIIVGLMLFGIWLLDRFHALVGPLVTTALVAYLLNLPVGWLVRRTGLGRTSAAAAVYLVVILLLILAPTLIGPRLVNQVSALEIDFQAVQEALQRFADEPIIILNLRIDPQTLLDQIASGLGNALSPVAASAFVVVANAAEFLGWLFFILVVSFLLVKELYYFGRLIGERVPASLEPDFYRLAQELGLIWNEFLRGRIVLSFALGTMTTLALAVVGMSNALALGILAGILNFIPNIGSILASIAAVLVALVRGSSFLPIGNFAFAILILVIFIIVSQIENLYLEPVILGRRVRLHPLVIVVGTIAGALTAGILGIFLAAPVIASARVLLGYIFRKLLDLEPFEQPRETPQALGVQWRGLIRGRAVEAVLFDLDGTLVETDDRTVEQMAQRLVRFERFLPGRDTYRVARRLVMWINHWMTRGLMVLDWLRLGRLGQRLARRMRLIEDHAEAQELVPVAGTLEMLAQLNGRYQIGIVSTRREIEIHSYLAQYGLTDQIEVVAGFDTTERVKPHPQPVLWAAQKLGVNPEQTAMVGDTTADMRSAKAAGALAVGVLCGFGERDDLADADLILDTTADLAQWL